ncbi:transporter substrate-binding domain-containing protein, partial [Leptospira borgpetersenii serovar Hardjo-bovis]|nr:transporter substrate-binding domain-containing protein [Leptospira borgpetersenii serovar Hardjo-bovis]
WPSIPWFGKTENHIAAIQARGVLRVSTIDSPLTYSVINGKKYGLDYELAQQFANYLGVKLKVTVRQNISQLFDDLDNGNADLLAAGLVYDSARVKNHPPGAMYYSVSQQLVYRVGQYRPRSLATVNENQLTIAPGHVVVNDLQR